MFLIITIAVVFLLLLFLLNFYRDPKRTTPKGKGIVAPADGRVISIIDTSEVGTSEINNSEGKIKIKKGMFGKIKTLANDISEKCYVISIFMSPLDVHINRAPISGKVKSVKHTKGRFFKAYDLEKSLQNEKNEIIIQNAGIKVKVIQIAGFLARRIKCHVKKNQKVNKGEKIGIIALSSQTTIIIPKTGNRKLMVNINDKVKAGETVIAA